MEDHKQSKTQPAADEVENILDLTEDMALADQAEHKIFDLTDDVAIPEKHPPVEQPSSSPASTAEHEIDQSAAATTDEPANQDSESESRHMMSDPEIPADKSAAMDEDAKASEMPQESENDGAPYSIEDEVSAAFDEVQTEPAPTKESNEEKSDQLFDKLSGITQMVDDAVRDLTEEKPSHSPPAYIDDATVAADAAELETALSGEDDDDEIIELTDIVNPSEVQAEVPAGQQSESGDDDIIDLVDIVDPAELAFETLANDKSSGNEDFMAQKCSQTDDRDEGLDSDREEDVILLTDVLKKGDCAKVISLADKETDEAMSDASVSGDEPAADSPRSAPLPPDADAQDATISDSHIEAAVEHLLKTKYADTVRAMVSDAVEKAVAREVEKMRQGLSGQDAS